MRWEFIMSILIVILLLAVSETYIDITFIQTLSWTGGEERTCLLEQWAGAKWLCWRRRCTLEEEMHYQMRIQCTVIIYDPQQHRERKNKTLWDTTSIFMLVLLHGCCEQLASTCSWSGCMNWQCDQQTGCMEWTMDTPPTTNDHGIHCTINSYTQQQVACCDGRWWWCWCPPLMCWDTGHVHASQANGTVLHSCLIHVLMHYL